ncbi:MAG TPA: VOC family protein [Sphingomonas sp.]|jgi:catechol 2,3-dioxygenase-like lactoylglutathione lyase family enzyme|nr:VOC family protein [Sphingomonas sp.]
MNLPFGLIGIDHVVLLVSGMDRARSFYERVLGCTLSTELLESGMIQMRAGESLIDLVDIATPEGAWARPAVAGGRNVDHVAIAITDCDPAALKMHLEQHGVAVEEEGMRAGARGESWSIYFRDPDQNLIELSLPA